MAKKKLVQEAGANPAPDTIKVESQEPLLYVCTNCRIQKNGRIYPEGEPVALTEDEAKALRKGGVKLESIN
jgi:hypothetical protein